jgi:hypothetical protein
MGRRLTKEALSNTPAPLYFAVLVPHRDSRRFLRQRSAELFASGLWGAWSFPHAAPLALLSAPLGGPELRDLARALRELTLEEGRDGMLRPGPETSRIVSGVIPGRDGGFSLYGPALDLAIGLHTFNPRAREQVRAVFSRPLVGCAVLGPGDSPESPGFIPAGPDSFRGFRAAAVANMVYRPINAGEGGYSFSWRIGELYWLPAYRRFRPRAGGPRTGEGAEKAGGTDG